MSGSKIIIRNLTRAEAPQIHGVACRSFLCQLKGLMFVKAIQTDYGLLFSDQRESRMNAAIHMFFMNFDIAVIWMDRNWVVVDAKLAQKGRPYFAPAKPAQYTLETHSANLPYFQPGDQLSVSYED